jgi:hypothetical protein
MHTGSWCELSTIQCFWHDLNYLNVQLASIFSRNEQPGEHVDMSQPITGWMDKTSRRYINFLKLTLVREETHVLRMLIDNALGEA